MATKARFMRSFYVTTNPRERRTHLSRHGSDRENLQGCVGALALCLKHLQSLIGLLSRLRIGEFVFDLLVKFRCLRRI